MTNFSSMMLGMYGPVPIALVVSRWNSWDLVLSFFWCVCWFYKKNIPILCSFFLNNFIFLGWHFKWRDYSDEARLQAYIYHYRKFFLYIMGQVKVYYYNYFCVRYPEAWFFFHFVRCHRRPSLEINMRQIYELEAGTILVLSPEVIF